MAVHYRSPGIFIKKENRGESDQIFTVYTKNFGKLKVLGRAIRKSKSKLRAGADLFYFSEIEFIQGKAYKTLTDAILIDKFSELRRNLKNLSVVFKVSQTLDKLIGDQEPDSQTWRLLKKTLERLNFSVPDAQASSLEYYYFFWNLMAVSGYRPEIYSCAFCGKKLVPGKVYFNSRDGGLFCPSCFARIEAKPSEELSYFRVVGLDTIKTLRIILKRDRNTLFKLKSNPSLLKELKAVSAAFASVVASASL